MLSSSLARPPHAASLLRSVVFPLMCFTDDDEELWRDDPHEYIRKVRSIIVLQCAACTHNMDALGRGVHSRSDPHEYI